GRGGVENLFDAERVSRGDRTLQLADELILGNQLFNSGADHLKLALDFGVLGLRTHRRGSLSSLGPARKGSARRANWHLTHLGGLPRATSSGTFVASRRFLS